MAARQLCEVGHLRGWGKTELRVAISVDTGSLKLIGTDASCILDTAAASMDALVPSRAGYDACPPARAKEWPVSATNWFRRGLEGMHDSSPPQPRGDNFKSQRPARMPSHPLTNVIDVMDEMYQSPVNSTDTSTPA